MIYSRNVSGIEILLRNVDLETGTLTILDSKGIGLMQI